MVPVIMAMFLLAVSPITGNAQETAEQQPSEGEFYISGFATHSFPIRSNYSIDGGEFPGLSLSGKAGAGAKTGYFPRHFNSAFGVEFELFTNGGKVTAPRTVKEGKVHFSDEKLSTLNLMFTGIARYPGDFIQPYIGVGIGLSSGEIEGESQNSLGRFTGTGSLNGPAFQALLGARLLLTKRIYLFTEYKYFTASLANDGCETCLHVLEFDYESFFTTFGAGLRF